MWPDLLHDNHLPAVANLMAEDQQEAYVERLCGADPEFGYVTRSDIEQIMQRNKQGRRHWW